MEQTKKMIDNIDTICAISTPPGVGGIAVVRVSGPDAIAVADRIWNGKPLASAATHTAHFGKVMSADGNILDECLATVFRAPRSFTGDDIVEFGIHGSRWIQREILNLLIQSGCRLAEPGEFTRRAFTSGKMDLAEAEAVADLIASSSRAAHRIAINQMRGNISAKLSELRESLLDLASLLELELDFSEEDVEFASRTRLMKLSGEIYREIERLHGSFSSGQAIKDGIPVAIIGRTNVGKSSLLNMLVGDNRAIVSDIHGTTRDIVEDTIEIGDYRFRFMDTAGIRKTEDSIENLGIERSYDAAQRSEIILYVIDPTAPYSDAEIAQTFDRLGSTSENTIILINKSDISPSEYSFIPGQKFQNYRVLEISAKTGDGIDSLKQSLAETAERITGQAQQDTVLITNARHAEALSNASRSIAQVIEGLKADLPGDLIAQDLRETLHHLSTITGSITTPDILATIFTRFCIGK